MIASLSESKRLLLQHTMSEGRCFHVETVLRALCLLQVHKALNVMKTPSLIRVEADEVQYPLHILLRSASMTCKATL